MLEEKKDVVDDQLQYHISEQHNAYNKLNIPSDGFMSDTSYTSEANKHTQASQKMSKFMRTESPHIQ